VENLREKTILNLKIGYLDYGNLAPGEISEYKQINTGDFVSSYQIGNDTYSGNINTYGTGKLKMQILSNGSLKFINEGF